MMQSRCTAACPIPCCGLIGNTGLTFTQRMNIGRMTAKLSTVLANSRLAMMAFIRLFFQDGLAGSA